MGIDKKTDFEKFIATCTKIKERRNKKLSKVEIQRLRTIYEPDI